MLFCTKFTTGLISVYPKSLYYYLKYLLGGKMGEICVNEVEKVLVFFNLVRYSVQLSAGLWVLLALWAF